MRIRPQSSARDLSSHGASPVSSLLTAVVMVVVAESAAAQRQFGELSKRGLPANEDFTRATVLGDVDGDGDLDLIVGNSRDSRGAQTRLYLNDGSGIFADATATRMPIRDELTYALALGDVDGDGDLDLVLGNGGPRFAGQSRLYLNDGSGTFTDATASRMPVRNDDTHSLALGDVDGDGDLDLVVGNDWTSLPAGQSRLYLNDGTGTFTDVTATAMPVEFDQATSVALGDVDGDGDLDLIIGNFMQQNRLCLNDGTGTFTDATATHMPIAVYHTQSLALGDVDGDGDLDLVLAG